MAIQPARSDAHSLCVGHSGEFGFKKEVFSSRIRAIFQPVGISEPRDLVVRLGKIAQ